jgi:NitT/TauT family transport system permease protein
MPQIAGNGPPTVHGRAAAAGGIRTALSEGREPGSSSAGPGPRPCVAGSGPRGRPRLALPNPRFALALYAAIPLAAGVGLAATAGLDLDRIARYLPLAGVDVTYSFLRMLCAYALSLAFALGYGYYAAVHRTGERVMIPILDILQSVPILGFFPFAIAVLAMATPHSFLGPNFASVFLIFTSMAWNMVFGVYESLKTLPAELREAAETFRSRGGLLFRKVLFPATVNRLVYNTVLSWTAGWFFLVEAEIFTTNTSTALAGIGSYLSFAASTSNGAKFLAGILALVVVIAVLDFAVWRPLTRWADRFRYDQTPSGEAGEVAPVRDRTGRIRRATLYVTRGVRTGVTRISTPLVQLAAITARPGKVSSERRRSAVHYLLLGTVLVLSWLLLIAMIVALFDVFTSPIDVEVRQKIALVPFAMGASALRVVAAYALCLAIALPVAIHVARSPRAERVGMPVIEVVASFPATALFPVVIFVLIPYLSAEGAAVLMLMTGMMWYLFFNILAGVRALPPDLVEAARAYGVRGRDFYRRVLLPGIFPALITGSVTAFGGGWNTLIVAEYLDLGKGHQLSLLGIGQLIDVGNALGAPGNALMATALLTLVAAVIAVNELLWKPLYRRAVERYRYD